MAEELETKEERWVHHIDELNVTLERIKALSHAMFAVVFTQGEFWHTQDMPVEEILPLSELTKELSDKADRHIDALSQHIRKLEGCDELTLLQESRKRLDQKRKDLLAEFVAFLQEATPEMQADLSQLIAIIKQQMKTRKEG